MMAGPDAFALIEHFERLRLTAYLCPAGVWTIGFGHTKGVVKGMVITPERARQLLIEDVLMKEDALNRLVKVKLRQYEFDALISWIFNVKMTGAVTSTLLRKLNEGAVTVAGNELTRWDKGEVDGVMVVIPGLTKRRRAEQRLYQTGKLPKPLP